MKKISLRKSIALIASLCLLAGATSFLVTAANTTYEINPSTIRMKSYSSIDQLRADSARIVVGTVTAAHDYRDQGFPATEYELRTAAGDEMISVLQDGSPKRLSPEGDFFLEIGSTYLLFLLHANATKTAHTPYYVTGVWSGIYRAGEDGRFAQLRNMDDELPSSLTVDDVMG